MKRRDLLKLIGIGGVGAVASVVGGKEVEAAPVGEAKPVTTQGTPQMPGWEYIGSSRVIGSANYWPMGSVTLDGYEDTIPLYVEMTPEQLRRFNDPFGGDE